MAAGSPGGPGAAEAAAELLSRRSARRSLLAFAEYTHPSWTTGEHHRRICDMLERVERGEVRRGMIFAPPRHTKSELASRRFPAWFLGRNPTKQIITATYAADFAVDFGADVRDIIRSQDCRNVFPGLALHPDRKAASRWRTTEGGIYIAAGVGGPITGRGAHLALIDDPVKNREDADSARKREKVWRWYNSTLYTRLMPDAALLLMMTRWHEDDLAGRLLKQGGWEVLELPAIANEDTDREAALWPEWFPLEELLEKRSKLPAREWSALYQQRPTTDQGAYCRREWFEQRYDTPPNHLRIYMASDCAVKKAETDDESRGPDYTEHGVFGVDPSDHVYVLDWWYGRTESHEWVERGIDLVLKWKPEKWFGEKGVIQHSTEPTIRKRIQERKAWTTLHWLPSITDKEARGRSFQSRASLLTWHFPRTPWADRVIDQAVAVPGGVFWDAFDTCSLFARGIDETHPAIAPKDTTREPEDRWDRAFRRGGKATGWKVA